MTIQTDNNGLQVAGIQPVKVYFRDTDLAVYLGISSISDNLRDACQVNWVLTDSSGIYLQQGVNYITGSDYYTWDGNNNYPFTFIGSLLGLTFV